VAKVVNWLLVGSLLFDKPRYPFPEEKKQRQQCQHPQKLHKFRFIGRG